MFVVFLFRYFRWIEVPKILFIVGFLCQMRLKMLVFLGFQCIVMSKILVFLGFMRTQT